MRSNAQRKQVVFTTGKIWVERPKQRLSVVEKEPKGDSYTSQGAYTPQDEMTSPDFEAFMARYGIWSDFA